MKMRLKWFVIPAFALGLGACKKEAPAAKSETPAAVAPGAPTESAGKTPETPAAPKVPEVTAEERAAKLGFARHLPKNVETVVSVFGAAKTGERAKSLKLWKFVEDQIGGEEAAVEEPAIEEAQDAAVAAEPVPQAEATDVAEAPAKEEPADGEPVPVVPDAEIAEDPNALNPKDVWGTEVTLAFGETSGEQIGNVLDLYGRYGYFQIRELTKALVAQAKTGEEGGMSEMGNPFSEQLLTDLVNDPEGGAALFDKMGFPPIYVAMKVDAAKREAAAQQISSSIGLIGSFGDFAEPVEIEQAGAKFTGYKVLGAKLSKDMAANREEMEKTIEPDVLDRLFASLAKKDVVILSGTIGDYVVLFLGGSTDQLKFSSDADDSLAGSGALKFNDPFLGKDIAAMMYGDKKSLQRLMESATKISDTAKGLRDGLAGQDGLGDTREIESLLEVVVEREATLRKLSRVDDSGTVAYFEEGLKIESFGGIDSGSLDWKAANKLGSLGDSADVVLFANGTINSDYEKASREFAESIFETAYAITRKVADLPGASDDDLAQFRGMAKMFDEKFRVDAVELWQAFSRDLHDGLGRESALVVDLKGAVPAIPGIPQAVVDQGKFPRASIIAPVADRSKLATAWEKTNKSTTSILGKVSEISGMDIPMQKPSSSERNGMTTWFFQMPIFNDDFLPSVTVSDQWFVASTSKTQALDLAEKASKAVEGKKGLVFKMNFAALQSYSKDVLKVVDANADAIFAENSEQFRANKLVIEKGIEAMDDFDTLTIHSNRDADYVRTSVHFKTR